MAPLQKCIDLQEHRTETRRTISRGKRRGAPISDTRTRQPRSSQSLTASDGLSLLLKVAQTADCGSSASAHPILKGKDECRLHFEFSRQQHCWPPTCPRSQAQPGRQRSSKRRLESRKPCPTRPIGIITAGGVPAS